VRFYPPAAPNWNPLGLGSVPDPFPIGRSDFVGIAVAEEGEKDPLFLIAVGRKALWARRLL
jgi:hypothetical protein